jgi:hypothetical protein
VRIRLILDFPKPGWPAKLSESVLPDFAKNSAFSDESETPCMSHPYGGLITQLLQAH